MYGALIGLLTSFVLLIIIAIPIYLFRKYLVHCFDSKREALQAIILTYSVPCLLSIYTLTHSGWYDSNELAILAAAAIVFSLLYTGFAQVIMLKHTTEKEKVQQYFEEVHNVGFVCYMLLNILIIATIRNGFNYEAYFRDSPLFELMIAAMASFAFSIYTLIRKYKVIAACLLVNSIIMVLLFLSVYTQAQ